MIRLVRKKIIILRYLERGENKAPKGAIKTLLTSLMRTRQVSVSSVGMSVALELVRGVQVCQAVDNRANVQE